MMEETKDTTVTNAACEDKIKQVINNQNNCFSPCTKRKDYNIKKYDMPVK